MTCQWTAAGAKSKAVKGLVGGIAPGCPAQRARWTADLIPRSEAAGGPCTRPEEQTAAADSAWGAGERQAARKEMRAAGKRPGSRPGIPFAKLAPWSAPGPSSDRQEHLGDMLAYSGARVRRRLLRALDDLTVRWAINDLPASCRWLLNMQVLFLIKSREPTSKEFDDAEWLDALGEPIELADVAEADVEAHGPELNAGEDISMEDAAPANVSPPLGRVPEDTGAEQDVDEDIPMEPPTAEEIEAMPAAVGPPKVRPIQMGEFLRKWISR